MTFRSISILLLDTLVWCAAGALVLFFLTLVIRAVLLGHVPINGKLATKLDEPVGYCLVLAAYLGCAFIFWLVFWSGVRPFLGLQ
jgi:hypothetical protein